MYSLGSIVYFRRLLGLSSIALAVSLDLLYAHSIYRVSRRVLSLWCMVAPFLLYPAACSVYLVSPNLSRIYCMFPRSIHMCIYRVSILLNSLAMHICHSPGENKGYLNNFYFLEGTEPSTNVFPAEQAA